VNSMPYVMPSEEVGRTESVEVELKETLQVTSHCFGPEHELRNLV
jgi:hypothetical protein